MCFGSIKNITNKVFTRKSLSIYLSIYLYIYIFYGLPVLDGEGDIPSPCWGKTTTMVVSARTNKRILRVVTPPRTPVEGTTRPNTPQQNELTCRSIHFSTDKPSATGHNHSKENQKSNNSTSKEEGQKSPNTCGNQLND